MYHLVSRTLSGESLARDDFDRARLWGLITSNTSGLVALCLMRNHFHLLSTALDPRLQRGLAAYVQGFNARWGRRGALFERRPLPVLIEDPTKISRTERYTHLNPSRAGVVRCPLAWAWSTHRDAVGLTLWVHRTSVTRVPQTVTDQTCLVWSVTGDPRFSALQQRAGRRRRPVLLRSKDGRFVPAPTPTQDRPERTTSGPRTEFNARISP